MNLNQNVKQIYQHIMKKENTNYNTIGQSIWNQYLKKIPWEKVWKNTFMSYCFPENNNILYKLLHFATRTNEYVYRWANQKHLKTPLCTYCKKPENIIHLFIESKKVQKIWKFFEKVFNKLNPINYTPIEHLLTLSANDLPKNK